MSKKVGNKMYINIEKVAKLVNDKMRCYNPV